MSEILGVVGDKWTVMTIMMLRAQPRRFNELKRSIGGVSQRMLTRTLRTLERDGVVVRSVHPTVPPQVEYALTPRGQSLAQAIDGLGGWVESHLDEIDECRARFDARHPPGPHASTGTDVSDG